MTTYEEANRAFAQIAAALRQRPAESVAKRKLADSINHAAAVSLTDPGTHEYVSGTDHLTVPADGNYLISANINGTVSSTIMQLGKGQTVDLADVFMPSATAGQITVDTDASEDYEVPIEELDEAVDLKAFVEEAGKKLRRDHPQLEIATRDAFINDDPWKVVLEAVVLVTQPMTQGADPAALKEYLRGQLRNALAEHVADSDLAQDYVLGDVLEETLDWGEDAPDGARLRMRQIWSALWRRVSA